MLQESLIVFFSQMSEVHWKGFVVTEVLLGVNQVSFSIWSQVERAKGAYIPSENLLLADAKLLEYGKAHNESISYSIVSMERPKSFMLSFHYPIAILKAVLKYMLKFVRVSGYQ